MKVVLSDDDRASALEPTDDRRVVGAGNAGAEDPGARGRGPIPGKNQVLEGDRNAVQRAQTLAAHAALRFPRLGQGFLPNRQEGVELRIERLDSMKGCLDHLHRRDLSRGNRARDVCGARERLNVPGWNG